MVDKKLLRKFMQGDCTVEERQLIMEWFHTIGEEKFLQLIEEDWHNWENSTGEHSDRLKHILGKLHTKISEKELDLVYKEKQIPLPTTSHKPYNYRKYLMVAVVSLLLVAAVTLVFQLSDIPGSANGLALKTKQVPLGQKATIYLNDGTRVILNAGSNLTFPEQFPERSREVLLEGEAFFEVVKDQMRPFMVISGDVTTVALGTSFNVKAYGDQDNVEVALATGKVEVRYNQNDSNPVILTPGELLNMNTGTGEIKKGNFITSQKLGWTEHLLYFKDAGAGEVFTTLERWYGVEFIFNKEPAEGWMYSGEFKNKSLEIVLEGISYVKEFEFSFKSGKQVEIHFK